MMSTTPNGIKTAYGLGIFGGVLSIALMAFYFKPEDDILPEIAFYMLTAVLFFAMAGAFSKNSQWSWRVALFVSFICIGTAAGCTTAGYFEPAAGALLIAIGTCIVILEILPSSKKWLDCKL